MKELSIEQKAKAYDEALKYAKHYHSEMGDDICCVLEECFPELKESEDEIIRKEIISYIKSSGAVSNKKWIAWLEGEHNLIDIHPIFRVGDYIRNKKTYDKVLIEQLDIEKKVYYYKSFDGAAINHSDFPFSQQNEWEIIGQNIAELWNEEDEKMLNHIISDIESLKEQVYCKTLCDEEIVWLKSLKKRVQPQ